MGLYMKTKQSIISLFFSFLFLLLGGCSGGGGGGTTTSGTVGAAPVSCTVCMTGQPSFSATMLASGASGTLTVPISSDVIFVNVSLLTVNGKSFSTTSYTNSGGTSASFTITPPTYVDAGPYYASITTSDQKGNSARYTLDSTVSSTNYKKVVISNFFTVISTENSGIAIPVVYVGLLEGVPYLTAVPVIDPTPMVAGRPAIASTQVSADTVNVKVTVHDSSSSQVEIGAGTATNMGGAGKLDVMIDTPDTVHSWATAKFEISDSSGKNISRYSISNIYGVAPLNITQSIDGGVTWSNPHATAYSMSPFDVVYPPAPVIAGNATLSPSVIYAGQNVDVKLVLTTNAFNNGVEFVSAAGVSVGTATASTSTITVPISAAASGDYYPRLTIADSTNTTRSRYSKAAGSNAYEEKQSLDGGVTWTAASVMPYSAPTLKVVQPIAQAPLMTAAPTINYKDVDAGYTVLVDVPVDANAKAITVKLADSSGTLIGTGTGTSTAAGTVSVAVPINANATPGAYYPQVVVSNGAGLISRYVRDGTLSVIHYTLKQSADNGVTWPVTGSVAAQIPWLTVAQPVVGAPVLTGAPTFDKAAVLPGEVVNITLPITTNAVTADVTMLYQTCSFCNPYIIGSATVTNSAGAASLVLPITMGNSVTTGSASLLDYVAKVKLTDATGLLITEYERKWTDATTYTVRQSADGGGSWLTYIGPLAANKVTLRYYSEGTLAAPLNIGTAPLAYNGVVKQGGSFGVFAADDGFDSYYAFTVKPYTAYTYVLSDPNNDILLRPFKAAPVNNTAAGYCSPDGANRCTMLSDQGETSLYAVMDAVYTVGGAQFKFEVTEYPVVSTPTTINFESGALPASMAQTKYGSSTGLSWALSTLNNATTGGASSLSANIPAFENKICFSMSAEGMSNVSFNYIADTVRNNGDFLTFYLNGVVKGEWAAQTAWKGATYALSGVAGTRDMLTWCLIRAPASSGLDPVVGYVDDIVIQ